MSYPILYNSTETAFSDNGLGILSDALSCTVTEERNGQFELQMQYPIDGIHYAEIVEKNLLLAKPNPIDQAQPFRIYRSTKPMNGRVTFYARHISYDLNGIPANVFTASSPAAALEELKNNAALPCPFEFWTDNTNSGTMTVKAPAPIRSLLGGVEGSVLDVFGGEYKFDRFRVSLYKQRGADRGVSIRYGKNLIDLQQEMNCASVYTGVYPYWLDSQEGTLAFLPEKIVKAEGTFSLERAMMLDLSSEYQEQPTETQLREKAQQYITANNITAPTVSLTVSHVILEQTEEYKGMALLERVELCDTVTIIFDRLGVSATAKAISMTYNVLLDRIESITFGDARKTLIDGINDQKSALEKEIQQSAADNRSYLQKAVDNATASITGNQGGYVVLHSSTGKNHPDELLVMDTPDIKTATNVWRWNKAGLGFSGHGYNGPYGTAITYDGKIVADYITTGNLDANIIRTGRIQGKGENGPYFDLDANEGRGELASSVLKGTYDGSTTTAYIGKSFRENVYPFEGIQVSTPSGHGGSFIIGLSTYEYEVGNNPNATYFICDGDLIINTHKNDETGTGNTILLSKDPFSGEGYINISRGGGMSHVTDGIYMSNFSMRLHSYEGKIEFVTNSITRATIENNGDAKFGDLYTNDVMVTSDRTKKKNIALLKKSVMDDIRSAKVYHYRLKDGGIKEQTGIMYDEAPDSIKSKSNEKAVDLYGMISLLWKAVQELDEKIKSLEQ